MPRYIDADAFFADFAEIRDYEYASQDYEVDAVEVVRCRECKYWEYDAIFYDGWCRGKHQGNPDWFCADGERREDKHGNRYE